MSNRLATTTWKLMLISETVVEHSSAQLCTRALLQARSVPARTIGVSRNLRVCLNEQQAGISLFQRVVNLKQNEIKCDPQLSVPLYDL